MDMEKKNFGTRMLNINYYFGSTSYQPMSGASMQEEFT